MMWWHVANLLKGFIMGMDRCNRYWHLLPGGLLALMLVACGGGGDDKPVEPPLEAPNQLPTASFSA